jgi:hypothetical protein
MKRDKIIMCSNKMCELRQECFRQTKIPIRYQCYTYFGHEVNEREICTGYIRYKKNFRKTGNKSK